MDNRIFKYKSSKIDPSTGRVYADLTVERVCPMCGGTDRATLFIKDGFEFGRCDGCDMIYTSRRMKEDRHVGEAYSEKFRNKDYDATLKKGSPKLRRLERLFKVAEKRFYGDRKLRILDVGSGSGISFYYARTRGYEDFYAVDVNPGAVEVAAERFGAKAFLGELTSHRLEADSFDIIILDNVLEHIDRPTDTLREVSRLLRKGGIVFISVPNVDSFIINSLGKKHRHYSGFAHLNYFTPSTLRKMCEACGLSACAVDTAIEEATVSRLFNIMAGRNLNDYDIGSVDYFREKSASVENTGRPGSTTVKKALKGICVPVDAVLIFLTNLFRKGSYIDAIFVKK